MDNFNELGVNKDFIKGLNELGIVTPTSIQNEVIPLLLTTQTDLVGQAQTGTGKTAAYGLPLLHLINPKEQFNVFKKIREEKLDLLGIYHSHVASEAYPSATDIELAVYDVSYLIVSLAGTEATIKAFKIKNGQVSEEKYVIEGTERS